METLRGIVGVRRVHQLLERLDGDPVALFELRDAPIAERDPDHGGDERLLAETGAHPLRVVVAPGDAEVSLATQSIDHAIEPRPAIAEIAADDDLVRRKRAK